MPHDPHTAVITIGEQTLLNALHLERPDGTASICTTHWCFDFGNGDATYNRCSDWWHCNGSLWEDCTFVPCYIDTGNSEQ